MYGWMDVFGQTNVIDMIEAEHIYEYMVVTFQKVLIAAVVKELICEANKRENAELNLFRCTVAQTCSILPTVSPLCFDNDHIF